MNAILRFSIYIISWLTNHGMPIIPKQQLMKNYLRTCSQDSFPSLSQVKENDLGNEVTLEIPVGW